MTPNIAMPFSGGQDSLMNLILQIKESPDPIHLFYFRMQTDVSAIEENHVKNMVPIIKEELNFSDLRLHIVDAFNFEGLSQEPNPFVPFRNYYFGQYLLGLGFTKILFSFSAEDTLFYDTSDCFMAELQSIGFKNLNKPTHVFTHTRGMCRIDYARRIIDLYGYKSAMYRFFTEAHVCSSVIPCRACVCCFLKEVAIMWGREFHDSPTVYDKKVISFLKHWQRHTTVRDFYRRILAGDFHDSIACGEYWQFLETFEKGALLKGLVI